jgi:hypothetical protein
MVDVLSFLHLTQNRVEPAMNISESPTRAHYLNKGVQCKVTYYGEHLVANTFCHRAYIISITKNSMLTI